MKISEREVNAKVRAIERAWRLPTDLARRMGDVWYGPEHFAPNTLHLVYEGLAGHDLENVIGCCGLIREDAKDILAFYADELFPTIAQQRLPMNKNWHSFYVWLKMESELMTTKERAAWAVKWYKRIVQEFRAATRCMVAVLGLTGVEREIYEGDGRLFVDCIVNDNKLTIIVDLPYVPFIAMYNNWGSPVSCRVYHRKHRDPYKITNPGSLEWEFSVKDLITFLYSDH